MIGTLLVRSNWKFGNVFINVDRDLDTNTKFRLAHMGFQHLIIFRVKCIFENLLLNRLSLSKQIDIMSLLLSSSIDLNYNILVDNK